MNLKEVELPLQNSSKIVLQNYSPKQLRLSIPFHGRRGICLSSGCSYGQAMLECRCLALGIVALTKNVVREK